MYSMVQDKGFCQMQQTMEPRYEIPSRKFFTKKPIPALYDETRGKVEDALQSVQRIMLS